MQPPSQFYMRANGRHHGYCKPCRTEYNRDWYQRNRKRHLAAVRRNDSKYYNRNRELLDRLKEAPCQDCGDRYPPPVMEFDHVRGEKVDNVSTLAGSRAAVETILAEVEKCDLVCANCHRLRTLRRREQDGG